MLGRCDCCAEPLTAADGPNLLGRAEGTKRPRPAFHLRCWVRLQAERQSMADSYERRSTRKAA